ncbi:MAG: prephenate dehydrogenase [Bacillota bacterium]|nr:prephenate dehydrogenase [Bacillota bacterium]
MIDLDFNITVVGLGLIGGSYAKAIRDLNPKNLWAVDINEDVLKAAEDDKIIDKGYVDESEPLRQSDIVIICLYPELISNFVKKNIPNFKPGAIITDAGSIKSKIVNEINSFIPSSLDFIGGHPMAGKENKGFEYASKSIFKGANYIITPVIKNNYKNIDIIASLAKKMGCKNIIKISPEKHDEIIAYTSQLPHVIAVSLVNSDILDVDIKYFSGGSYRDMTRIASINSDLWSELFTSNSENLVKIIEKFEENINIMKNAIRSKNTKVLNEKFQMANTMVREVRK